MTLPDGKPAPSPSQPLSEAFIKVFKEIKANEYEPSAKERFKDLEPDNPRVAQCCHAYIQAFQAARERGASTFVAEEEGARAFRYVMPTLTGRQNIRDFIACVAQGMLLEGIDVKDGGRLLYAAQVAQAGLTRQSAQTSQPVPEHQPGPTT